MQFEILELRQAELIDILSKMQKEPYITGAGGGGGNSETRVFIPLKKIKVIIEDDSASIRFSSGSGGSPGSRGLGGDGVKLDVPEEAIESIVQSAQPKHYREETVPAGSVQQEILWLRWKLACDKLKSAGDVIQNDLDRLLEEGHLIQDDLIRLRHKFNGSYVDALSDLDTIRRGINKHINERVAL